jgi:nitroreductase
MASVNCHAPMSNPALDHLLTRRSVSANALAEPGPNEAQLAQILTAAARVPDHKKLVPWRFVLFQGEAREAFGRVLAEVCRAEEAGASAFRLELETKRFLRAPLVVAVISRVTKNPAAPEWEQVLSAGAACQNLIVAASALDFGAQWITEWYAYSEGVRQALRLADGERVAGFVYIGTAKEKPDERERPLLADIVTSWQA